ncbi:MAG: hypothetical protein FWG46_06775 [Treponema sp.]|nr:hypothetical protein [Treponema sp.]
MGLLGRAASRNSPGFLNAGAGNVQEAIENFRRQYPLFHCIVMQFEDGREEDLHDIAAMTALHGAVCLSLSGGKGLVLLPGALDMELFSHQLSESTGSTVAFQFTADSPSLALETLCSYL